MIIKEIHNYKQKKIGNINGKTYLMPGNPKYKPINVKSVIDFAIWGTVVYSIHPLN